MHAVCVRGEVDKEFTSNTVMIMWLIKTWMSCVPHHHHHTSCVCASSCA